MIHGPNIPGPYAILVFTASDFRHQTHAQFPLWPRLFILSGAVSNCPPLLPKTILDTFQPGGLIFRCLLAFSYCSWGFRSKNTGAVCHFLLQWPGGGKGNLPMFLPGMGEPGVLPSMGSHRVRHNWHDLASPSSSPPWTTFCQNSPPWSVHLGWPYMAWLMVSLI